MNQQKTSNIAVLGAGVMGLCAAVLTRRAGHDVTLYEPQPLPADNASAMAGGMLAPYAEIEHMPESFVQAGLESIRLWEAVLPGAVTHTGSLLVAHPQDHYILERFRSHLPAELQNYQEVMTFEPSISGRFMRSLFLEGEAFLDPEQAMAALSTAIRAEDITIHPKAVTPEEITGNFDHIIDCRGMDADDTDLRGVKGETLLVRNPEFTLSRPVRLMHPRYPLYIIPRGDGVFMIGATVIESEKNSVTLKSAMELMSALYALHPSFGEAEILDIKAGLRPSLPRQPAKDNAARRGFILQRNVSAWLVACARDGGMRAG